MMLYIIDDNPEYLKTIEEACWDVYKNIQSFQDGESFIANATSLNSSDIIILDLVMPKMDGIEVLRYLAKNDCEAQIILVSGCDKGILKTSKNLAKEYHLNIHSTLSKPFSLRSMTSILLSILGKSLKEKIIKTPPPINDLPIFNFEELREAINNKQLILHFQPQIDLKTSQLIGVEALVRWQHPKLGLIYPDNFIPLAEELNLIDDLTNEVINLAIRQEAEWKRFGYNIVVSINISAKNVTSLSLPEKLQEMIDTLDIDPANIKIEITETELMNELTKSLDVLTRMRLKGFDLSIDDFGTGYSSLAQIKRNPFTELKIDRSFIMNATKDEDSLIITESCIQLGHKLDLKVVAEGIEDKQTLELLTDLGCDIGQGYYICKPICGDELLYWLHGRLKRTSSSCLHSLSRNH